MKKVIDWARGLIAPCPSIFDVGVAALLATPYIARNLQGFYLVFCSIFLCSLTIGLRPKREYKSLPLMLLVVWAFIGIFLHNTDISIVEDSFMSKYFNTMILFEGFIYIFCGALLVKLIASYARNIRFIYLLLPISVWPLYKFMLFHRNLTVGCSFIVAVVLYLYIRKKFILGTIGLLGIGAGFLAAIKNVDFVLAKWQCRPWVWGQLILSIKKHPFIGRGFPDTLWDSHNVIYVSKTNYGWLFRHNDYLSLADYLGAIVLVFLGWFIIESLIKIRKHPSEILFLTASIICFCQMTMFYPDRAAVILIVAGLSLWEGAKLKEGR